LPEATDLEGIEPRLKNQVFPLVATISTIQPATMRVQKCLAWRTAPPCQSIA